MHALMTLMTIGQGQIKTEAVSERSGRGKRETPQDTAFLNMFAALLQGTSLPEHMTGAGEELLADDPELAALVDELINAELADEQMAHLLAGFAQILAVFSQKTDTPEINQLVEQITRMSQQYAHGAVAVDTNMQERLLAEWALLLNQMPDGEKRSAMRQLIQLFADLDIKSQAPDSQLRPTLISGRETAAKNDSNLLIIQQTVPESHTKEKTQTTPPSPAQSGAHVTQSHTVNTRDATGPMQNDVVLPKLQQHPRLGTQVTRVDAVVASGGELTETVGHRSETATNPVATTVSANSSTHAGSARSIAWMAGSFTESLQQHIVRHLQVNHNGVSQARLSLYPEHLGQVDVRISSHNSVLTAHLVADTWLAKELLDGQLDQLRLALQNQGMQVNKLEVSIGQQGLMSRHSDQRHEGERNTASKREQSNASVNPADLYLENEASQVESWRNPHASVNYTV